jgi:hypothetical protein
LKRLVLLVVQDVTVGPARRGAPTAKLQLVLQAQQM